MANLKEVKNRIKSVTSTQQITKAMKMVAAAKLRRAQDAILQMRPYAQKLTSIINNVSSSVDTSDVSTPYADQRELRQVLMVVASSDRGLCGGFNSAAFKHAKAVIKEKYAGQDVTIMPIGKKSLEHFQKRGYKVETQYSKLFEKLTFDGAREAAEFVMEKFVNGDYDQVEIVYNEFKNVATQIVRNEHFLPIKQDEEAKETEVTTPSDNDYIIEPSEEEIFTQLIPKSLKIQFYKTLLESNASEHGARMT
ncbi:MAG: ATP synthase F1 subunit gamma, partial [Flavobacteriales bacterium]|nr:ATP synthase F1 subunit gamma [Flavobacteriales bacterium]